MDRTSPCVLWHLSFGTSCGMTMSTRGKMVSLFVDGLAITSARFSYSMHHNLHRGPAVQITLRKISMLQISEGFVPNGIAPMTLHQEGRRNQPYKRGK